MEDHLKDRQK
jgi:t-SNARE complex subunit (syntaxin)